jgi:hypothetical protein
MIGRSLQKTFSITSTMIRVTFVFALVLFGSYESVNANEKSRVLDNLKRFFGSPVDAELNLYSISKTFVVQATFQDDRLTTLEVVPKERFNSTHPNWKESREYPTVSLQKYRDLMKKFAEIKPIGMLVYRPSVLIVTNHTAWSGEYFENAFVEIGFRGEEVRVLTVNYFKILTGKVLSKTERGLGIYEITLEEQGTDWNHRYYYVKKDIFDSLVVDQVHSFEGAFVN